MFVCEQNLLCKNFLYHGERWGALAAPWARDSPALFAPSFWKLSMGLQEGCSFWDVVPFVQTAEYRVSGWYLEIHQVPCQKMRSLALQLGEMFCFCGEKPRNAPDQKSAKLTPCPIDGWWLKPAALQAL